MCTEAKEPSTIDIRWLRAGSPAGNAIGPFCAMIPQRIP
jgi:hypothetical protein